MLHQPTVPTTISVIDLCPNCEAAVIFEDSDGILSCPNCGCPQEVPHVLSLNEWDTLLITQPEPLGEAGWAHLLAYVDQLDTKEA